MIDRIGLKFHKEKNKMDILKSTIEISRFIPRNLSPYSRRISCEIMSTVCSN